ncbi:MAG: VOC family protein [Solirubrobacterales bacterium]|nr:VOC family protein [Solirubrobacterales bacterium]MBV9914904.1 VOC family protein [Solirubrobacterales bacterium]
MSSPTQPNALERKRRQGTRTTPRALKSRPGAPDECLLCGVNHITVLTGDLDRLVSFYEEVFGARKLVERPCPNPTVPVATR